MSKIKVLFVCMGNICRSPTAEGVFRHTTEHQQLAHLFTIDSAGTHAFHIGDAPDLRAQKAARDRGIDLSQQRARKFIVGDFHDYGYVLAMDDDNYSILKRACPAEQDHKIRYFLEFAPHLSSVEVPDPYYGGTYGFERVLDMVEAASLGFIEDLKQKGVIK